MGFRLDGNVGVQYLNDGNQQGALARFSRDASLVIQESHGKYYEAAVRGQMYHATTLTGGIALIVAATTGNHPSLWNPQGSGYVAEIVRLDVAWISGATAPTALYWMRTAAAGASIGTAAPVVTWTNVTPVNARTDLAPDTIMQWAPAVCTFAAVPVFYKGTGIGLGTGAPTVVPSVIYHDYDGSVLVGPGTVLSLCSQAATTTALYQVSVTYILNKL
jgi:hypothetical protein